MYRRLQQRYKRQLSLNLIDWSGIWRLSLRLLERHQLGHKAIQKALFVIALKSLTHLDEGIIV